MSELPFGIRFKPRVAETLSALVDIDDHIGKSSVIVETWWSGEGITITVDNGKDGRERIDLTWSQWTAVKMCAKSIINHPKCE